MNSREKNMMTEVKVMIAKIQTDLTWIKKSEKEHNVKLDENKEILTEMKTGFKNHLKHHESEEKKRELTTKKIIAITTIGASIVGAVVSLILHFVGG